jgi:hypothetical protein
VATIPFWAMTSERVANGWPLTRSWENERNGKKIEHAKISIFFKVRIDNK